MSDLLSDHLIRLAKMAEGAGKHQDAYNYYLRVLEEHPDNAEAWLGKGIETGWLSNATQFRLPEMVQCITHALDLTPEAERTARGAQAAEAINLAARAAFKLTSKSLAEFIRLDDNWDEYMQQSMGILDALMFAHDLAPNNPGIIKNAIKFCFANIQGISYDDKFDRDDNGFIKRKVCHLPRQHEKVFKARMDDFVAKRRLTDPGYRPPKASHAVAKWAAGVLVGLAVLGSSGWAIYCAMPAKARETRVVNPGISSFARAYIIDGLDPGYGVNTCRIMEVAGLPDGKYEVTGQVQPRGQKPVLFQLTVRYHPESPTLTGRYVAESAPRFEAPLQFSQ